MAGGVLVIRGQTSIGSAGSQQAKSYRIGGYRTVTAVVAVLRDLGCANGPAGWSIGPPFFRRQATTPSDVVLSDGVDMAAYASWVFVG